MKRPLAGLFLLALGTIGKPERTGRYTDILSCVIDGARNRLGATLAPDREDGH